MQSDGVPDGSAEAALGDRLTGAQVAVPAQSSWEAGRRGRLRLAKGFLRVVYAVGALLLFILALEVLRAAAGGVADILTGVSAQGSANILGFGWLGAYGALSGSPVAAIALRVKRASTSGLIASLKSLFFGVFIKLAVLVVCRFVFFDNLIWATASQNLIII